VDPRVADYFGFMCWQWALVYFLCFDLLLLLFHFAVQTNFLFNNTEDVNVCKTMHRSTVCCYTTASYQLPFFRASAETKSNYRFSGDRISLQTVFVFVSEIEKRGQYWQRCNAFNRATEWSTDVLNWFDVAVRQNCSSVSDQKQKVFCGLCECFSCATWHRQCFDIFSLPWLV